MNAVDVAIRDDKTYEFALKVTRSAFSKNWVPLARFRDRVRALDFNAPTILFSVYHERDISKTRISTEANGWIKCASLADISYAYMHPEFTGVYLTLTISKSHTSTYVEFTFIKSVNRTESCTRFYKNETILMRALNREDVLTYSATSSTLFRGKKAGDTIEITKHIGEVIAAKVVGFLSDKGPMAKYMLCISDTGYIAIDILKLTPCDETDTFRYA